MKMSIVEPRIRYARFFAGRGDLANALFWSNCQDVPILSAAGMALQVLKYADELSPYRIDGLLQLGEYDEILSLWKYDPKIVEKAHCWGKLAVTMPERVLEHRNLPLDVRSYCLVESGRLAEAEALKTSPFMRWKLAIRKKNDKVATSLLQGIFRENALDIPALHFSDGKLFFPRHAIGGEIKKGPLISIIMTSYNEEKHIETAIDSILAQRYAPIELIIVDDASNDSTPDIIRKWAEKDSRIHPFFLKENQGTWNAKNYALEKASGKYVMMHDADDWSHPDKLKLMQEAFEKTPGIQCVSSRLIRVSEHSGEPFSRDVSNFIRWNPSSLLFHRSFIHQHGNYLNMLGADCEMIARHELLFGRNAHLHIRLPLSVALARKHSLSSNFRGVNNGRRRLQDWETWRFAHVEYIKQSRGDAL